jgi:hypothetical protein
MNYLDKINIVNLRRIIVCAVGILLLWSGIGKWVAAPENRTIYGAWVEAHPFLGRAFPLFEIALALCLICNIKVNMLVAVTGVLISGFTGVLAYELTKVHPLACGCAGSVGGATLTEKQIRLGLYYGIFRNALMLLGIAYFLASPKRSYAGSSEGAEQIQPIVGGVAPE